VIEVPAGASAGITETEDGNVVVENLGDEASLVVIKAGVETTVLPGEDQTVIDVTPPVVTPSVTGTLGLDGWYTSDVAVSWDVTDPDSAISSTTGCGPASVTSDTTGVSFTCLATSEGGTTTSAPVTVKRDATDPAVAFSSQAGAYTVDQTVAFTCSVSDATSGLASSACAPVNALAYTFPLGLNNVSRGATDRAGNDRTASSSFSVSVTPASLCSLNKQFVRGSAKYVALTTTQRKVVDALHEAACTIIKSLTPHLSPAARGAIINKYAARMTELVGKGWLTSAQAGILNGLAQTLR
jgi:hypothetical protein